MKIILLILALAASVAVAGAQTGGELKIGPGDLLTVEVFDVPELKQEIRVSDIGDAELSLIGRIHLADLTIEAAEQSIASQLKMRGLVVHPQVSLLVREYATQGVAVTGEVRKPGIYQVLGPRTLTQVISEAGGLTEIASPNITVEHRDGTRQLLLSNSRDALLHPGDTVLVARVGIAYIVGDVARSGGYVMRDGGELSIAQLVALGGGPLPTAKATKVRLVRKHGDTRQEIEINLKEILRGNAPDVPLLPDDIVFVPNSGWKSAATRLQSITQMTVGAAIYTSLN